MPALRYSFFERGRMSGRLHTAAALTISTSRPCNVAQKKKKDKKDGSTARRTQKPFINPAIQSLHFPSMTPLGRS